MDEGPDNANGESQPQGQEQHIVPVGVVSIQKDSIVEPMDLDLVERAIANFEKVKSRILKEQDFLYIGRDGSPTSKGQSSRAYICKSGWRRIATAFNLDCRVLRMWKEETPGQKPPLYMWNCHVRVTAPNGRAQDAIGACSSRAKFFALRYMCPTCEGKVIRDKKQQSGHYCFNCRKNVGVVKPSYIEPYEPHIKLTAQTIAFNRAISDLVGGGEVSAEEMKAEQDAIDANYQVIDDAQPAPYSQPETPDVPPQTHKPPAPGALPECETCGTQKEKVPDWHSMAGRPFCPNCYPVCPVCEKGIARNSVKCHDGSLATTCDNKKCLAIAVTPDSYGEFDEENETCQKCQIKNHCDGGVNNYQYDGENLIDIGKSPKYPYFDQLQELGVRVEEKARNDDDEHMSLLAQLETEVGWKKSGTKAAKEEWAREILKRFFKTI